MTINSLCEELAPCPFCGGTDIYVQNAGWQANTFMRCPSCKTTFSLDNGTPRAHADTVAAWNRRTLSADLDNDPLRSSIYEVLRDYRLSNMVFDGTDDPYCLVDSVTANGQPITDGEQQLRDLADEIAFVVSSALDTTPVEPSSGGEHVAAVEAVPYKWEGYWPGAGSIDSVTRHTAHRATADRWEAEGADVTSLYTRPASPASPIEQDGFLPAGMSIERLRWNAAQPDGLDSTEMAKKLLSLMEPSRPSPPEEDVRAEALREARRIALRVGNFGDYRREELTADHGQPRYDMMVEIVSAIDAALSTGGRRGE